MKNKRKILWVCLGVVLLVLNVWRWMPVWRSAKAPHRGAASGGFELRFPLAAVPEERAVQRDLFAFGASSPSRASRPVRKAAAEPTPTPTEAYHLMGTVSEPGHARALLGKGGRFFQVQVGDRLEDAFLVRSIDGQGVELNDEQTGEAVTVSRTEPTPQEGKP